MKNRKTKKSGNLIIDIWETASYIIKGLYYYFSLLIDFLFGNVTSLVMHNLLKVTIVFLTIVSFYVTFAGLNANFYDTWTSLFVTIGVQGTLMALSLYVPIHQSGINLKNVKGVGKIAKYIKKYIIWIPLICCLFVSGFFSYVALSQKIYSNVEEVNNQYNSRVIFNEILQEVEEVTHRQISEVETNIDDIIGYINDKIDKIDSAVFDSSLLENRIKELDREIVRDKSKYLRSIDNYERYQDSMSSTVDSAKRKINSDKADIELEYIEYYESLKIELETLTDSESSLGNDQVELVIYEITNILEDINRYNLFDINLDYENLNEINETLSNNLDKLGLLDIRISYFTKLVEHKRDLEEFELVLTESKKDLMNVNSIEDMKNLVFKSPLDKTILSPNNLDLIDINTTDTFRIMQPLLDFERMTHEGVNQIEKSLGYLTNNRFPLLAYLAIFMAFFVDGLILIQGFSVTKEISKSDNMTELDRQEFVNWLLRKQYKERDPETNQIIRMKTIDKFLSYCIPNTNCTKIYLDIEAIRVNPNMSMIVNMLNQLGYLIINQDGVLVLDPDLMILYLQRSSLMVDTEYYHHGKPKI